MMKSSLQLNLECCTVHSIVVQCCVILLLQVPDLDAGKYNITAKALRVDGSEASPYTRKQYLIAVTTDATDPPPPTDEPSSEPPPEPPETSTPEPSTTPTPSVAPQGKNHAK